MRGIQSLNAIDSRPTAVVIADQLRERIIDGAFEPGDQINEAQLATQLNVSRGPVREALHRLVQEGLLIGRPNRGVFVQELTLRDIAEVYEAREVIECAAAEHVVGQAAEHREQLADTLALITERMREPLATRDWSSLSRVDLEFHTTLVEAGGNSRLVRAYQTLATEALICLNHFAYSYPQPEKVVTEHLQIAEQLRTEGIEELHLTLHDHLSLSALELHSHHEEGEHRHGRNDT